MGSTYVGLVGAVVLEDVGDVDDGVEVVLGRLPPALDVALGGAFDSVRLQHLQNRAEGRDREAEHGEREEEGELHVHVAVW